MKDVVTYLITNLVQDTKRLTVSQVEMDGKRVIQVQVAPHDLPRVIGEQGKVFRSLRNLVSLVGADEQDIVVEIAS